MRRNRSIVDFTTLPALFPHRVARAAELIALGLTSTTVYANTRPGGRWQRLLPGILLLSNAPPSRVELVQAALRYAGEGAVLTGHDALRLHGIRAAKPDGPVHVLIPHDRQVRSADTVVIERTTRMPKSLLHKNFSIAPAERAVLDAARRMRTLDGVRAILAETVQRGAARPAGLRAELAMGSNRGSALARQVLTEVSDGVQSVAEAWARRLILDSHLPKPAWNVPICDAGGQLLAIVDAWWDDTAVAWEIDSYEWHLSPENYAATVARGSKLTAAGITVVHTTPARIQREPGVVVRELDAALTHARARPRPDIVAGLAG